MTIITRGPGMDHALYEYSPVPGRAKLTWPQGATLAVWISLYLEFWELEPPLDSRRAPGIHGHWGNFFPDFRTYSYREYGNRVGIFRIFEVLDRHEVPVTVAANAMAIERYPELVEECMRRNWEIVPHGRAATQMITGAMSEEEERDVICECVDTVRRVTGTPPMGWISQDYNESTRTPQLVAEAGLQWLADWPNDDQPYWMTVSPPVVSIPQQPDWDDVQLLWMRQQPMWRYPQLLENAARRLAADGASSARTFDFPVHPWLLGQPHRIDYLEQAIAAIERLPGVWWTTGSAIAAEFSRATAVRPSSDSPK